MTERFPVMEKVAIKPDDLSGVDMDPRAMRFTATRVVGHGSDDDSARGTDLVMVAGRLGYKTCADINTALGLDFSLRDEDAGNQMRSVSRFDNPPEDGWSCDRLYTGEFEGCADPIGDRAEILEGVTSFCVDKGDADGAGRSYIHVLIAR